MDCIKKCWSPPKKNKIHSKLTKQRSISSEAKMNQLIYTSTPNDRIPFIEKCKFSGIIPETMAQHMRRRLNTNATAALENLYFALCGQIKAELVQNVAEGYRYNSKTYAQLEAHCREFGIDVADVADYFEPARHVGDDPEQVAMLRDAVRGKRDCPLG